MKRPGFCDAHLAMHREHRAVAQVIEVGGRPRTILSARRSENPTEFSVATSPLVLETASPHPRAAGLPEGMDLLETVLEIAVAETTAVQHRDAPHRRVRAPVSSCAASTMKPTTSWATRPSASTPQYTG